MRNAANNTIWIGRQGGKHMKKKNFWKLLLRYHFLVVFGISFAVYLSVLSVQAVCKPGGNIVRPPVPEQNTTAEDRGEHIPGGQPVPPTQNGETNTDSENTNTDNTEGSSKTHETRPEPSGFVQADMSYLDGALFIGDSRTITLSDFAGWDQTHFFVETGLTIWTVLEAPIATVDGVKMTVENALMTARYDKIYIQLGINELGRGTPDSFREQYETVVSRIRELQPQAVVFIQSIMHVSQSKDDQGTYINNAEVNARNEKLRTLTDGKNVFWLDENEVFDEPGTGKLNPEYTSDGVHLKPKYIPIWQAFLLSHAVK